MRQAPCVLPWPLVREGALRGHRNRASGGSPRDCWERGLDIALSAFALLVLTPVIAVAALMVKLTSRGPVFYRQERVGIDRRCSDRRKRHLEREHCRRGRERRVLAGFGRPFMVYKFRTMVADAEAGSPVWAQRGDPRVTTLGRFLRRSRIDEIPQFINVLRGDMGVVGPRPERAYFIGRLDNDLPEFRLRTRTRPGITGLAQVQLGYANSVSGARRKLQLDLEYMHGRTFGMYCRILLRTVHVVLTGRGAC